MGEASRRGDFKERKEQAVIRNKLRVQASIEAREKEKEKKESEMTQEQRSEQMRSRIALLSMMTLMRNTGLTQKQMRRRVKRVKKTSTKTG